MEYIIEIKVKKKLRNYHIKELKDKLEFILYDNYDIVIKIKEFFISKV